MFDASVFTSEDYSSSLAQKDYEGPFYISPTLARLLESPRERATSVLSYFTWDRHVFVRRGLPRSATYLKNACQPYEAGSEAIAFAEKFILHNTVEMPKGVTQILIEEVAFLKEHSILVMRARGTLRLLRKLRVPILDFTEAFFDLKDSLPKTKRGKRLKWLIGGLLQLGGWSEVARGSPIVGMIANIGGWVIWATDP